jgi:hypothetical protein
MKQVARRTPSHGFALNYQGWEHLSVCTRWIRHLLPLGLSRFAITPRGRFCRRWVFLQE